MFEPGTLLAGRYRVERRLGSGGLATVLLATDLRLERRVAVKRLNLAGDSEEAAERLRREARLGASFDHPHLVAIYDAVAENGLLVVMEWVDGENLAERMRRGALGAEEAIS